MTDTGTDLNKPDRPVDRRMFVWPLAQKYSEESILDCHSVWIVCYIKDLIDFYHVSWTFLNTFVAVTDMSNRDRPVAGTVPSLYIATGMLNWFEEVIWVSFDDDKG